MDVSEYFDWRLELHERLLLLEYFLGFFDEELDNLDGQVDERDYLRVLLPVSDDIVVEVVDDDVHNKVGLILQVLFRNTCDGLLELLAPLLLDVEGLGLVLRGTQVPVEKQLELLPVLFFEKALVVDGGQISLKLFWEYVLLLVTFGNGAASAVHIMFLMLI